MLETGNLGQAARAGDMTAVEARSEFSMWAILASPLVITTPLLNCSSTDQINGNYTPGRCRPSVTPLQQEILLNKEVLAINQQATPAGRLLTPPPSNFDAAADSALVYARNLTGGDVAVAFYNPSRGVSDASVNFSALGWPPGTSASVRDLWQKRDLALSTNAFPANGTLSVKSHETVLLRLQPKP